MKSYDKETLAFLIMLVSGGAFGSCLITGPSWFNLVVYPISVFSFLYSTFYFFCSYKKETEDQEEIIKSFERTLNKKLNDKQKKEFFLKACKDFQYYRKQPVFYCKQEIIYLITWSHYAKALERFIKTNEGLDFIPQVERED